MSIPVSQFTPPSFTPVTIILFSIVILSEVSQTEKDKYHLILLIYGILKKATNELIYKTETESLFIF